MPAPSRSPYLWLAALLLTGGAAGAYYLATRKRPDEDEREGSETVEPMSQVLDTRPSVPTPGAPVLAPPLALPLRGVTPHGQYGAPRPAGASPDKAHHFHQGVDLKGKAGEPILAVGNGRIVATGAGQGGVVRKLVLDDGRAVVYADLGTATVEPGARVRTGDQIGTMRKNGFVHVAIRSSINGPFVNPKGLIPFAG